MALIKEITLPNGIVTNYHRVANLTKDDNIVTVMVVSYVSKVYRQDSNMNYVNTRYYTFEDIGDDISFEVAYNLLKTNDDFKDSENG